MTHALQARGMHVHALAADLTHKDALASEVLKLAPDWVIHLAALSFVGEDDPEAFYRVNVFGTLHLLEALALLKKPPQRVLVASSANIYGTPNKACIDESVTPAPINHYACSKLVMEHMVDLWSTLLPLLITRPFNYTGVGQDVRFLIPKIVSHFARRAASIELGNLDVSRDFSDVRDVVAAYIRLLDVNASGVKVNVCRGQAISLRAIIERMTLLTGHELTVRVNPSLVREHEIPVLCGDNRLLKQLIGDFETTSMDNTLADMYEAMQ